MTLDLIAKEVYDEIMDTWTGHDLRRFFSSSPRDLSLYEDSLGQYICKKYNLSCSTEVIEYVWRNKWPPLKA